MTYTANDFIRKYVELRDDKKRLEAVHAEQMKPINEAMQMLEGMLGQLIIETGADSIKCESGTAYRSKTMAVRMRDKKAFVDFAFATAPSVLDIRASKKGIQEFLEGEQSCPVPGVDIDYLYTINVRRKS